MRILVDVLHPAHVHFFRHFLVEMELRGHEVHVASRVKDVTVQLLDAFGIEHRVLSRAGSGALGLAREWVARTRGLIAMAREVGPDVLVGCMGPAIASTGLALRVPSVVFYNNESARLVNRVVQPLASAYVTSTSYQGAVRGRHVTHESLHELAYLHPTRFEADRSVFRSVAGREEEPVALVRFVALKSSHDRATRGFANRREFLERLSRLARVIVTSEGDLPPDLERYRVRIAPEKLHDLLAGCSLQVGESATLAAEAAVLGVPSIYVANSGRGYLDALERDYALTKHLPRQEEALAEAARLLENGAEGDDRQARRKKLIEDMGDLTGWMVRFFEARGWERPRPRFPA